VGSGLTSELVDRRLDPESGPAPKRRSYLAPRILLAYGASRLVVLGIVVDLFGVHVPAATFAGLWDGRYYLAVAAHGYPTSVSHTHSDIAFFPLYPLVVRGAAALVGQNVAVAAILVSLLTGAAACVAVGALVRDVAGRGVAGEEAGVRAGWLMAFAPGAMFLSPAYPEGLGITLCAGALVMLGRRRWLVAGLLAGLATAASSLMLPIVAAAAWAAWRARTRRAWMAPVLACAGVGSYFLYLWVHTGTPFAWFDAQRLGWGQHVSLLAAWHWLFFGPGIAVVETISIALAIAGLWAMGNARVPSTWWVYTVALAGSILFGAGLWMTPRLLLSLFPLSGALALGLRPERFRVVLVGSGVLMALAVAAYTTPSLARFVFQP
jgi:hypothetical protein